MSLLRLLNRALFKLSFAGRNDNCRNYGYGAQSQRHNPLYLGDWL